MGDDQLARAEALAQSGDIEGARALGLAILAGDPGAAGAHNLLGFLAHSEGNLVQAEREFELAAALSPGDGDIQANLDVIRAEIEASRGASDEPPAKEFGATLEQLRRGWYGPDVSARLLGRLLASELPEAIEARLLALPGATSNDERRFLCRFASRFWDGQGDVFENGPMLGSTTRALALGMLNNPRRSPDALLQTFDWFHFGDDTDVAGVPFAAMVQHGLTTPEQLGRMQQSGSFKELFDSLHAGQDYSPLLRSHTAYLPGHRGELPATGEPVFEAPEERRYSLVFIDGCKSWHGTRHCMERLAAHVEPGAHFIFQDYGWYTCFWLSTFVGVLGDHFRLVANVDDTYTFELTRELTTADVVERFPDEPADLGRDAFDDLYTDALLAAGERADMQAIVTLTIHHAGALAVLGHREEAYDYIRPMLARPELFAFRRRFIEPALRSPTYMPEGEILL